MNKFFLLTLSLISFSLAYSQQMPKQSGVYLSSYLIPKGSDTIGELKIASGQISSITLVGENAGVFKIDNDRKLKIRREKLKPGINTIDINVSVKTTEGTQTETLRIVKDEFIKNKVIAHRGAWKNTGASENSIAAFNHAVKLGCEGSEFDVHMSADSIPVVNHDNSIQGISIAKTPARTLLALKLSNGETLPTLESYLMAGMAQTATRMILEIKASELGKESTIALTRKVVAMVERLHAQAWTDYISFDYEACKEVMTLAPYAKVAYLKGDKSPNELVSDKFFGLDYHFSTLQKNPDWIKDAQRNHLTINVWTVNDKVLMEDLLKQQVDFITTNEPELLLQMVK